MKKNDLVIVEGAQGESVGALVMWSLQGGFPNLDKLRAEASARGLDPELIPESPSPKAACRRAADAIRKGRKRTSRPNGGWLIRSEKSADNGNDVNSTTQIKVYLDSVGRLVVEGGTDEEQTIARAEYEAALETPARTDVSVWLAHLIVYVRGVAVRRTGGTYYVPPSTIKTWEAWCEAIEASSTHRLYAFPAMKSAKACELFLESLREEAQRAIDTVTEGMLAQHSPRWFESRIAEMKLLEAKQASYETLLGGRLADVTTAREALNANLSAAMFAAMAAEDAA